MRSTSPYTTVGNSGAVGNTTRVVHRTYLQEIVSPANANEFASQTYALNPGLASLTPWVFSIAAQFEQWRPLGMRFCFVSTSTNYSASTALGKIVIATEYNPTQVNPAGTKLAGQPFSSTQEMENSAFVTVCRVDQNAVHSIDTSLSDRPTKVLYIRQGAVPSGQDIRFYDLGNTQIAVSGCPTANVKLGELWLEEAYEFIKPIMNAGLLGRTVFSQQWYTAMAAGNSQSLLSSSTVQASTPFVGFVWGGSTAPTGWLSTYYLYSNGSSESRIYMPSWFQNGTFKITILIQCGATAAITPITLTYNGSLSEQTSFSNVTQPVVAPESGVTAAKLMIQDVFYVNGPPTTGISNYIAITGLVCSSTTPKAYITIDQVNDNIITG